MISRFKRLFHRHYYTELTLVFRAVEPYQLTAWPGQPWTTTTWGWWLQCQCGHWIEHNWRRM